MRLRHSRSFNQDVVEHLLLGQSNDLLYKIVLQSAANTSVLHPNHGLVTLDQGGVVDQALVNVELGHVVDNHGSLEVFFSVLGLQDVLQQSSFSRPKKSTQQGHRNLVRKRSLNKMTLNLKTTLHGLFEEFMF